MPPMPPPLAYGTNLHPAETLDQIIATVVPAARGIRERLGWERLGVDLRLGLAAIRDGGWARLRKALDAAGLSAHTINGFPLRPFQAARVKENAYLPDWSDEQRWQASADLLKAAFALSDEPLVTISTVPGSWKAFGAERNDPEVIATNLGGWAALAAEERSRHRRVAVLCLEPEPGCTLETIDEVVAFWEGPLAEHAVAMAAELLGDEDAADEAVATHLGICFDTCHASLAFEDQAAAVARLDEAGIPVPKCQFSAAPACADPAGDAAGLAALRGMAEPRFLHQLAVRAADGRVVRGTDLDRLDAVLAEAGPGARDLRAHFHIPVDAAAHGALASTVGESRAGLAALLAQGCPHLAVETYTWSLLAADEAARLDGTARELAALAALAGRR